MNEEGPRSAAELSNLRVEVEQLQQNADFEEHDPKSNQKVNEEESPKAGQRDNDNGKGVMEELNFVRQKLEELQLQLLGSSIQENRIPLEQAAVGEPEQVSEEEFPALIKNKALTWSKPTIQLPQLFSWKDKVTRPNPPVGMTIKYVPPTLENGSQVVQIDTHDAVDLVKLWERAVVVYVVGGIVSVDILRGYIRKHWSFVSMPVIHNHEVGFFILRFNTNEECEEILKGGPYFLNRAPMIVKKWSTKFDFKEEVMRVIPVTKPSPSLLGGRHFESNR